MDGLNNRGVSVCRGCGDSNLENVLDLGQSPVANSLPTADGVLSEPFYPLNLMVCHKCGLGQIGEFENPDQIFKVYPYLSSTSTTWIEHGKRYTKKILEQFPHIHSGYTLEVASNDGYLLQHFKKRNIPVLGIEPAINVADIANKAGIPTISAFFGVETAEMILKLHGVPELVIANNVAAHVPDMFDFFSGLSILCGISTIITIENPSLGYLIDRGFYDTIYHEHFSYLSVKSVKMIAERVGMDLFEVETLDTHGGSLRYYLCQRGTREISKSVESCRHQENSRGVESLERFREFSLNVNASISELNAWVSSQEEGSIIGFGAAAKTVTTFHAAKLDQSKFKCIVDSNHLKQGRRLPGTTIPILSPELIRDGSPTVLIFPWNIHGELLDSIRMINPNAKVWVHNPLRTLN